MTNKENDASESPSELPPSKRIARYDEFFDQRTFSTALRKTNKPRAKLGTKRPVLLVRRVIDEKGKHTRTEIDIKSPSVCQVLRELNEGVESLRLSSTPPMASPDLFFHSREGLAERLLAEKAKSASEQDSSLIADLEAVMVYIAEDHTEHVSTMASLLSDFTEKGSVRKPKRPEITYELLWALFKPNCLVYHYHEYTDTPQILLCRSTAYKRRRSDQSPYCEVACEVIANDGSTPVGSSISNVGLARVDLEIDPFIGARSIMDLNVYPLQYFQPGIIGAEDKDAWKTLKSKAVERGKRFIAMEGFECYQISGPAIQEKIQEYGAERLLYKTNSYGRVMIDPISFRQFEPNCGYNLAVRQRLDKLNLSDDQYAICTPVLLGFCFGIKKWGGFSIDRLKPIEWSLAPFDALVISPPTKTLLHALVAQHARRSSLYDDIVAGKGKGLIALFSGNPGTGKTLTAEAIAEKMQRALYVVSAGELGTKPHDVEEKLGMVLSVAERWGAVLLLDEAEVFLASRTGWSGRKGTAKSAPPDVMRNALVSIFLRHLEYYQGILILTTNLVEECDPAFESRIHFSVHYPDLNYEARLEIWKTFIKRAGTSVEAIASTDLERLSDAPLNGRQIKNIVGNALSIALEKQEPLGASHIFMVIEVMSHWQEQNRREPIANGGSCPTCHR